MRSSTRRQEDTSGNKLQADDEDMIVEDSNQGSGSDPEASDEEPRMRNLRQRRPVNYSDVNRRHRSTTTTSVLSTRTTVKTEDVADKMSWTKLDWPPALLGYFPDILHGPEPRLLPTESEPEEVHGDTPRPIRWLNNFTFYYDNLNRLCATGNILGVRTLDEEDESDTEALDSNDYIPVRLGQVEKSYHNYTDLKFDSSAPWILTAKAWYILEMPAVAYQGVYSQFALVHALVAIVLFTASANPRMSKDALMQEVIANPDFYSTSLTDMTMILGRAVSEEDFNGQQDYIGQILTETVANQLSLRNSHLLKHFLSSDAPIVDLDFEQPSIPLTRTSSPIPSTTSNAVSPLIYSIAASSFLHPLTCLGTVPPETTNLKSFLSKSQHLARKLWKQHENALGHILLGSAIEQDGSENECFEWVEIDGSRFQPGDVVIVAPEDVEGSHHVPCLGSTYWFIEITYIFQPHEEVLIHGQWFEHGSETVLGSVAHPQELFLINACDDISAEAIIKLAQVEMVDETPKLVDPEQFFCKWIWDKENMMFTDLEGHLPRPLHIPPGTCVPCAKKEEAERVALPHLSQTKTSLVLDQVTYHLGDFIYLPPHSQRNIQLFQLGQISSFRTFGMEDVDIEVWPVMRQAESLIHESEYKDERLLRFPLDNEKVWHAATSIMGKLFVIPRPSPMGPDQAWLKMPDHFFIENSTMPRQVCQTCLEAEIQKSKAMLEIHSSGRALKALDIFSGCGGFAVGLDHCGYVNTKWFIEYDESACLTLKQNRFKGDQCFGADVNTLLKDLWPKRNRASGLPSPHEVDLIYCGPPCQSFSLANSNKKTDDHRHSLSMTALSFVDYYNPTYFMMENVVGMLSYELVNANLEPIQGGIVRIIFKCLLAMGYQARINVLQAGAYGTPQGRRRLIILASKRNTPLPQVPTPTHTFPKDPARSQFGDLVISGPSSKVAACQAITVNDAISDLAKFHWKDPVELRRRGEDPAIQFQRQEPSKYPSVPKNQYQTQMRRNVRRDGKVTHHFTKPYSDDLVQKVLNVAMQPNANWTSLPLGLRPERYNFKQMRNLYSRINGDGFFPTSMCNISPSSRDGKVIHPNQKRVITIREYARSQGFPDTFEFLSVNNKLDDIIRQIGNAVPIPLGIALGREFGKAILKESEMAAEKARLAAAASGASAVEMEVN